jgi:hypothetical protein
MSPVTIDALTADDIRTHALQDLCELVCDAWPAVRPWAG